MSTLHTPPPAPKGHVSHIAGPKSDFGLLATLAHDPAQPAHVRAFHHNALHLSLAALAAQVRSIAA